MTLAEWLETRPYEAYVYAYPHKTAYGPLPGHRLEEVWSAEDRSSLSLYVHVPFCEMRCGFCNLFTTPRPRAETVERFVTTLERQAARAARALGDARYARLAIGGGTPTLLEPDALARVFDVCERTMGAAAASVPSSVETSPETCLADRLRVLKARGVERVSLGVQSFVEAEAAAVNRPQRTSEVAGALDAIRTAGFPILNLDLIYGLPGQTAASWEASLRAALCWQPEELFLYPLYVRPVTTLSRRRLALRDERLGLYRLARELLAAEGYAQVSMRMFRRVTSAREASVAYCVQDDGTVGLGPGARSYTRALHYSTEWAVGARGVQAILEGWLDAKDADFDVARWGFALDEDEQRRRWVAYSLFGVDGISLSAYRARFGGELLDQLPALQELLDAGAARHAGDAFVLGAYGLERSDAIGPWLWSEAVRERVARWTPR